MHDPLFLEALAPIVVGDYAWLGSKAMVLPGVKIGKGAVVAAGAIVTKDVSPFTVVGGIPARPIGERPRHLRYELNHRANSSKNAQRVLPWTSSSSLRTCPVRHVRADRGA